MGHQKFRIAAGVAGLLTLVGLVYYASPYWAVRQMRSAAQQRDADRLSEYVDFPAVRESIKAQAMAKFMEDSATELKDNPFAGFAGALASAFVDKLVDSFVTPTGMATLMEQGKPAPRRPASRSSEPHAVPVSAPAATAPDQDVQVRMGYTGLHTFDVAVSSDTASEPVVFKFRRDGLFGWKLRSIRLPL